MAGEALEELARELDVIAERLSDQAMDVLRAALSEPAGSAAAEARATERLINRARSSVEKAARVLRQASGSTDHELAGEELA